MPPKNRLLWRFCFNGVEVSRLRGKTTRFCNSSESLDIIGLYSILNDPLKNEKYALVLFPPRGVISPPIVSPKTA
jgi:hypothetical protein